MLRILRARTIRFAIGIWLLAIMLVPGVCAVMCSTHTCPACAVVIAHASAVRPCCGHCMTAAVTKGSGTICPNADDHCCCKERKDPAFVAVKPHGPVEASILIGQTPMAIPDLASTLDFKHEPVLFSIPEFTSGAPPGVFLENNRARAPPICSA